jgi:hypothetical protein
VGDGDGADDGQSEAMVMSVMASAAAERAAPGHALGQGGRGPGERREVDPSAHQGVIEHHDPERAFDLRIQVRQPLGQGLQIREDRRRSVRDPAGMPDGWRMTSGVATGRMVGMDPIAGLNTHVKAT